MFHHGHVRHYKQYVTNWATRLTKSVPIWRAEVESSKRHEVLFTQTLRRREHFFPMISSDMNAPLKQQYGFVLAAFISDLLKFY